MKRVIAALVIIGLFVPVASAQEPEDSHHVYFPQVFNDMPRQICDRPWRLIEPEASTNIVLNPSAETTGNFAANGGGVVARSTTYAHYGLYSYHVTTAANNDGIVLITEAMAASAYFVTVRVHGTMPPAWRIEVGGVQKNPRLIERIDQDWTLYGIDFSAVEAAAATAVLVVQSGAGGGDFYVDGVQAEEKGHWTTYIDGTQDGCSWNGAAHASTSTRSAAARTGGRPRDFQQSYGLFVEEMVGVGTPPVTLDVRGYSILPGGELAGSKLEPREFTLIGTMSARSKAELHAKRQRLAEVLLGAGGQPIRLEYKGASTEKYIDAIYTSGLEGQLPVTYGGLEVIDEGWQTTNTYEEKLALQFTAPDPAFYAIGEKSVTLDTNDSATVRGVTARLVDTGQWDDLGPPNAAGTYGAVYALAEDATYLYVGGNFLNFDNVGNADYIARYNKHTGAWSALGTGMNNVVYDLAIGADGTLYATGDFTTAGGGAALRVASWNGAAWAALGAGLNAGGSGLAIGLDGALYVGGAFTTAGGGGANYIAKWSGGAWSALGAGMNTSVFALSIAPDGSLYAGGAFVTAGGVTVNYVAKWDGAAWSALAGGMDNQVTSMAIYQDGTVYAGGDFTTAGGNSANYVASWNGTGWSPLGSGANGRVDSLAVGPDGLVLAGGSFTAIGGIGLASRIAVWNGATWAHMDIAGLPIVYEILPGKFGNPTISSNYDIFVGFETTATVYYGGLTVSANDGSSPAYPRIVASRSGGTSAVLERVRNESLGLTLWLNYSLLDGETLVIDLLPTQKNITSSMFGQRMDAVLANSDFGQWHLKSGDNDVTAFINVAGGPTTVSYLLWKDSFSSLD
jgi:hypothetical protein